MATVETLKLRVREISLNERVKMCRKMIGGMCSKGRPPKMTIPVHWDDEDFFITTTLTDLEKAINRVGILEKALAYISEQEGATAIGAFAEAQLIK